MKKIRVAIAGNPNSGKTTLFNSIAGTNYHVGNYPGVTVEKKEAIVKYKGYEIEFVDLPGTYSLGPYSMEEIIARDFIVTEKPDIVVHVVDASNLERNLYLTTQFLELEANVIISLNMVDIAEKRDIVIDDKKLSEALNIPVVRTIARTGMGKNNLLDEVINYDSTKRDRKVFKINYGNDISPLLDEMEYIISKNIFSDDKYPARWIALKYIESDEKILEEGKEYSFHSELLKKVKEIESHLKKTLDSYPESIVADYKYGYLSSILKGVLSSREDPLDRVYTSDKIDKFLTNRLLGPVIMLFAIYGVYQFTFWTSEYPIGLLESLFEWFSSIVDGAMSDGLMKSLITSGIIDGVGGVLGFTPLIFLMFAAIAVLEDSGYMARIAYMLDRVFKFFGLQGCSVVSFIVSGGIAGGCAVPGIMASRTIRGQKERVLTILTAPFMMCGAKIPVFALLIAAFYPGNKGFAMMMIMLFSWLSALTIAKILGKTLVRGESSAFIMELPPYRMPTLRGILIHAWERTWMYIKKAGTVILGVSILLWVLMTFPGLPESKEKEFESQIQEITSGYDKKQVEFARSETGNLPSNIESLRDKILKIENNKTKETLKGSIAGRIGTFLEPATKYAGFDWRTNIALVGGFAAKEVVVSTLGTAYSLGEVDPEETGSLAEKLASDPDWSKSTALALIIFTILYAPCFIAVVAIVKEVGYWKWGLFTMGAYTLIAYIAAVIVYQIT